MTLIVSVTSVNYNDQIKDITFTKNYVKQLIESIHKATINELFNAVHSEVQTYQLTLKIYKIVFNFKIALKSTRNVAVLKNTAVFDSRLIFQNFLNFVHQICFEVLIYCNSTNKTISVNIELAHLLFLSVLHAHVFQMSSIASSFLKFIWIYFIINNHIHRHWRLPCFRFFIFY